jgi:hypothetical protein
MVQLPLSLFVFRIFANDVNNAFAPNDTALGATLANGGRYFHEISPCSAISLAKPNA